MLYEELKSIENLLVGNEYSDEAFRIVWGSIKLMMNYLWIMQ